MNVESGLCEHELKLKSERAKALAVSPNGQWLAVSDNREIVLFDTKEFQRHEVFRGHTYQVNSISFSADGTLLASGGLDGVVRVWRIGGRLDSERGGKEE